MSTYKIIKTFSNAIFIHKTTKIQTKNNEVLSTSEIKGSLELVRFKNMPVSDKISLFHPIRYLSFKTFIRSAVFSKHYLTLGDFLHNFFKKKITT